MKEFEKFLTECRQFLDCNNEEESLNVSFPLQEQDLETYKEFLFKEFEKGVSPFNSLFSLYIDHFRGKK